MATSSLSINKLVYVIDLLKICGFPEIRWADLGLRLGLLKHTLEAIKDERCVNSDCLTECLSYWLRGADEVDVSGGATLESLSCALESMNEIAVAKKLAEKKSNFLSICIFNDHHRHLSQSLCDPVGVARMLHNEGVLKIEVLNSMELASLPKQRETLLNCIKKEIGANHRSLQTFASVLCKFSFNAKLGNAIHRDYDKEFLDDDDQVVWESDVETASSAPVSISDATICTSNTQEVFIPVPRSMSPEFSVVRASFSKMFVKVQKIVTKEDPSIDDLKIILENYDSQLQSELNDVVTLCLIFRLIRKNCSLIDVEILQAVVDHFEINEAQEYIKDYKKMVEESCKKFSATLCCKERFEAIKVAPHLKCETATFIFDWEPEEHVLKDIMDILSKTTGKLVKIKYINKGNSITVTCSFFYSLAGVVIMKAIESLEVLIQNGLMKLTIGYCTVWEVQKLQQEKEITGKQNAEVRSIAMHVEHVNKKTNEMQPYTVLVHDTEVSTKSIILKKKQKTNNYFLKKLQRMKDDCCISSSKSDIVRKMCMEQRELLMKIDDLDFYYAQIVQSSIKVTKNEIIKLENKRTLMMAKTRKISAEAILQEIILKDNFDRKGLTIEDLKIHQCSENVLVQLSKSLDNWELLGFYLGLTVLEVKAIKFGSNSEAERKMKALNKWKEKNENGATYYNLIEALNDSDQVGMIDLSLEFLKEELAVKQKTEEGVDFDILQEEDISLLCGCGACTLNDFLKNSCPNPAAKQHFPLLNVTKLTTHTLVVKLIKESRKVGEKFAGLFYKVVACLEDHIDVNELLLYISSLQKFLFQDKVEAQSQLKAAETKSEVMELLKSHVSWFNHNLIGSLVYEFKVSVESYEKYVETCFNQFLKKSLFEIPNVFSNAFQGSGYFVLRMATPSPTEIILANVLTVLEEQLASALCVSIDALEFCCYSSQELTFRAPYTLLKEMIPNNDRLLLVLQNITNIAPEVKIHAIEFEGNLHLVESSKFVPTAVRYYAKMTKVDRMFASLMVKLVRSMTSKEVSLDELKKFICNLIPHRSITLIDILPMFDANLINEVNSVSELLMFLKDYWSFCNFSLLMKIIKKFGDDIVNDTLTKYVTILQELTVQEIPLLLHHRSSIDGFSSDTLTVTTTDNILSLSVEKLLFIRDIIAQILEIEKFALILLKIKKDKKQIEFLIASQVTVKISPLAFSSINEAHITHLQYQEVELNQDKKNFESDDDNNDNIEDDSNYGDSGLESLSSIYASDIEQEQRLQVEQPKDILLPKTDFKDDGDTALAAISCENIRHSGDTKIFPPIEKFDEAINNENAKKKSNNGDDEQDEWPSFDEVIRPKILSHSSDDGTGPGPQLNVAAKLLLPEVQKGVLQVCKLCLKNSNDESLLFNKCLDFINHSPVQLVNVTQDPNSKKLFLIRPRPLRAIKGNFQLCDKRRCKGEACEHAHSVLECDAWNFDLKKEKKGTRQSLTTKIVTALPSTSSYSVAASSSPTTDANKDSLSVTSDATKARPANIAKKQGLTYDERGQWKVNFEKRLKVVLDDDQVIQELTTSSYRDKFYSLLCFEEAEHIQTLSQKCDGRYKIQCCRKLQEESKYICRMLGMDDDQVQYATQASEGIIFIDTKNQKDLCKGTILSSNFRDLSEHFFVSLAIDDFRLLQKNRHIGSGWYEVNVEFEVKHSYFNSLHQAIISIPDSMVKKITPSSNTISHIPLTVSFHLKPTCPYPDLLVDADKQFEALKAIFESPVDHPVTVSGPFGSGKTRIIARAAYEFIQAGLKSHTQTRILLCAHHTNTVETYMLKYLHPVFSRMSQVKIIRITRKDSYNFSRNVMNRTLFDFKRDIVIGRHINDHVLVIITTYMSSLLVAKILNKVRFTHILLDEAAQVREPEAIAPLSLGDAATKVIVAGDTKQVGPSVLVLGEKSRKYGLAYSLLERLEKKYQEFAGKQQEFKYLKFLATNYRCCPEIVEFLSSTIYKYPITCAPEACSNKQHPAIRYPLVFYWCNCNDTRSKELKGLMEFVADAVVRQAQHYFSFWPHEWDSVKMRDVCIISPFRTQLNIIESKLKKVGLGKLTLLPSYLIQGHEFQAVVLTTFEPLESDGTSSNPTKSLTNPQIFNTAVSRSKSFVVAVGDPFSLLKAEKQFPERCWKQYLSICLDNDTIFFPESYKPKQRDEFKKKLSAELVLPEKAKSAEYPSHSH